MGEDLKLPISDADVAAIIERWAVQKHPLDGARWAELTSGERSRYGRRRLKQALFGAVTARFKRSQQNVRAFYEESWQANSALEQVVRRSVDRFEWRGQGYEAYYPASPALHNYLVSRALRAIQPKTALEVGCGSGLQTFVLASRHPDVRFHGAELTASGVREAQALQQLEELPEALADFAFDPVLDRRAHKRVEFREASAADLPYEDGSMDVVYTTIALEQMEEIREAAVRSLARVARRYVVMVEPFRDFNGEGVRRDYVRSRGIFAARIADLTRYGLKPVVTYADFPSKVSLGVGFVLAAV